MTTRGQVNDIANFCYLTQETNLWVTNRDPAEYFAKVEDKYPGALASQWIPLDPELWQMGRYLDFLEARRVLLAEAANQFLNSLLTALPVPVEEPVPAAPVVVPEEAEVDEAVVEIGALLGWMRRRATPSRGSMWRSRTRTRVSRSPSPRRTGREGSKRGWASPSCLSSS